MKWIDALFACALVILGATHILSRWFFGLLILRSPWGSAAAVAIITMGLMNLVRSQRKKDALLRWSTSLATALTTALCLSVLYHTGNVLHELPALATCILAVIELFFAVLG